MAKSKIMIDNSKVRVTEWVFDLGDETGHLMFQIFTNTIMLLSP